MSKIRVTTKKEYIVEWDDGRKIEGCERKLDLLQLDGHILKKL